MLRRLNQHRGLAHPRRLDGGHDAAGRAAVYDHIVRGSGGVSSRCGQKEKGEKKTRAHTVATLTIFRAATRLIGSLADRMQHAVRREGPTGNSRGSAPVRIPLLACP